MGRPQKDPDETQVLQYIKSYINIHGDNPMLRQIAKHFGTTISLANRRSLKLEAQGKVKRYTGSKELVVL